jgi:hypothetical protein
LKQEGFAVSFDVDVRGERIFAVGQNAVVHPGEVGLIDEVLDGARGVSPMQTQMIPYFSSQRYGVRQAFLGMGCSGGTEGMRVHFPPAS